MSHDTPPMEAIKILAADVLVLAARLEWVPGHGPALAAVGMVVLVGGQ